MRGRITFARFILVALILGILSALTAPQACGAVLPRPCEPPLGVPRLGEPCGCAEPATVRSYRSAEPQGLHTQSPRGRLAGLCDDYERRPSHWRPKRTRRFV